MNVDELSTALHEPASVPLAVNLDEVLARGRRRRTLRRATVSVAVLATTAAVAIPVALVGDSGARKIETAGPARTTPVRTPPPVRPSTIPSSAYADVIRTGERVAGTERVFVFRPAETDPRSRTRTGRTEADPRPRTRTGPAEADPRPSTRFVLGMGFRTPGRPVRSVYATNETDGRDDAAGFHAGGYAEVGPAPSARDWTVLGYYAGPAVRITARVNGTPVTARTAQWPGYPRIVVFWLSPGTGSPRPASNSAITDLRAYDAAGVALPSGAQTGIGIG